MKKKQTLAEYVWEYENQISDPEAIKDEKEKIMALKTIEEVEDYYMNERGWESRGDLLELMSLVKRLVGKFGED